MTKGSIDQADFEDTGYCYTLSLISGKYKTVILYCLMEYQPVRFNEMRRYIPKISDRTLSQCLKELEADGLIARRMYPQIPPKVEYSLTDRGASLVSVLDKLCDWGTEHRHDDIPVGQGADSERSGDRISHSAPACLPYRIASGREGTGPVLETRDDASQDGRRRSRSTHRWPHTP